MHAKVEVLSALANQAELDRTFASRRLRRLQIIILLLSSALNEMSFVFFFHTSYYRCTPCLTLQSSYSFFLAQRLASFRTYKNKSPAYVERYKWAKVGKLQYVLRPTIAQSAQGIQSAAEALSWKNLIYKGRNDVMISLLQTSKNVSSCFRLVINTFPYSPHNPFLTVMSTPRYPGAHHGTFFACKWSQN